MRYLLSGDRYKSLKYSFRMSDSTISIFIPEVCQALANELVDQVVDTPVRANARLTIEEILRKRWNVPHALGALDGKHVHIKCLAQWGSLYIITTRSSIPLFSSHWWTLNIGSGVDLGASGSCTVLNQSHLKLHRGPVYRIPCWRSLSWRYWGYAVFHPGDDAFALRTWLMKPVPGKLLTREQKIYIYRISRGCRVVEHAFSIMANWFRFLQTALPEKVLTWSRLLWRVLYFTTSCDWITLASITEYWMPRNRMMTSF